jgi:hypothetical protein
MMNEQEALTVTLTLDNNEELDCAVLTIYEVEGQQYIALLPLDEEGNNEEGDVFLYRFSTDADGEPKLDNIEDDEEYERAADKFDEWLDTQEYEDLDLDAEDEE